MMGQKPEKSLLGDYAPLPRNTETENRDAVLEEAIAKLLSEIDDVFEGSTDRFEAKTKAKPAQKQKSAA